MGGSAPATCASAMRAGADAPPAPTPPSPPRRASHRRPPPPEPRRRSTSAPVRAPGAPPTRILAEVGRIRANLLADHGPNFVEMGRTRTQTGRNRPKLDRSRAKLADAGRVCPNFGHIWPKFDRNPSASDHIRPNSTRTQPNTGEVDRRWPGLRRCIAEFDQRWAIPTEVCPTSADVGPSLANIGLHSESLRGAARPPVRTPDHPTACPSRPTSGGLPRPASKRAARATIWGGVQSPPWPPHNLTLIDALNVFVVDSMARRSDRRRLRAGSPTTRTPLNAICADGVCVVGLCTRPTMRELPRATRPHRWPMPANGHNSARNALSCAPNYPQHGADVLPSCMGVAKHLSRVRAHQSMCRQGATRICMWYTTIAYTWSVLL